MGVTVSNRFSAAGSAVGYLVQIEYALLIALQKMDDTISLRLSLETADDITFEPDGSVSELWQTKHHIGRRGSLGDASPDLWKTLHNWIETAGPTSACFLFSTAAAPTGSVAAFLKPGRNTDDVILARGRLDAVAEAAGNTAHEVYYAKYLKLSEDERLGLLTRVFVLDCAVEASGLTEHLVATVRKTIVANRRLPLIERLRGWWHGRVLTHLTRVAEGYADWIDLQEIEDQLHQIAQTLRDDNLPLDFTNEPHPEAGDAGDRIFVEQLKIIMLHHHRIRQAIYDHNRAFLQRSRWQREQLLAIGELDIYDARLIEEWNRVFLPVGETVSDADTSEADKRAEAQNLYMALQGRGLPEVRSEMRSGYMPLGTLHILADRLEIGWHPDWIDLLQYRISEVRLAQQSSGVA